jgi:hypothetical protein
MRLSILAMFAFLGWAISLAQAQTIILTYRPGGMVMSHVREADRWLHQGVHIEVTDWQMSSAAMQIVYFYRRGGTICYRDSSELERAYLQFHQPQANGVAVENYRGVFVHFMGEEITAMIGPVVVNEYKAVHASEIGIPLCASSLEIALKVH